MTPRVGFEGEHRPLPGPLESKPTGPPVNRLYAPEVRILRGECELRLREDLLHAPGAVVFRIPDAAPIPG